MFDSKTCNISFNKICLQLYKNPIECSSWFLDVIATFSSTAPFPQVSFMQLMNQPESKFIHNFPNPRFLSLKSLKKSTQNCCMQSQLRQQNIPQRRFFFVAISIYKRHDSTAIITYQTMSSSSFGCHFLFPYIVDYNFNFTPSFIWTTMNFRRNFKPTQKLIKQQSKRRISWRINLWTLTNRESFSFNNVRRILKCRMEFCWC